MKNPNDAVEYGYGSGGHVFTLKASDILVCFQSEWSKDLTIGKSESPDSCISVSSASSSSSESLPLPPEYPTISTRKFHI